MFCRGIVLVVIFHQMFATSLTGHLRLAFNALHCAHSGQLPDNRPGLTTMQREYPVFWGRWSLVAYTGLSSMGERAF